MQQIVLSALIALAANAAELKTTSSLQSNFKDGPKTNDNGCCPTSTGYCCSGPCECVIESAVLSEDQDEEVTKDEDVTEDETSLLDKIAYEIKMNKALWTGIYSGLYSVTKKGAVPKPTAECLSDWIVEDLRAIENFKTEMFTNFWAIPTSEFSKTWYAAGDLMFKNDDYCHFKLVLHDVSTYCSIVPEVETSTSKSSDFDFEFDDPTTKTPSSNCSGSKMLEHLQKNVFNRITQFSGLAATFNQEGWADLEDEDKAYNFQQLGHTVATIFVDITGFKPTVIL